MTHPKQQNCTNAGHRAEHFEYMQSVCVFENISFCSLFTNRLRPFRDFNHHTVTSINHPILFSSETWDAVLSSLSLSVFHSCNAFCQQRTQGAVSDALVHWRWQEWSPVIHQTRQTSSIAPWSRPDSHVPIVDTFGGGQGSSWAL